VATYIRQQEKPFGTSTSVDGHSEVDDGEIDSLTRAGKVLSTRYP